MDLWVRRSSENAERVLRARSVFGAPRSDVETEDFQTPNTVFQIGVSPRRIDILTTISGVDFEEAWPERREIELEGLTIPVLGREHLIQNKRALGRPRDQADIDRLVEDQ